MAIGRGISEDLAALMFSFMGITNTVGRVAVGAIVYKFPINPFLVLVVGCVIGGVLTGISFLYQTFATLAVYALLFGNVYGESGNLILTLFCIAVMNTSIL